MLDLVSGLIVFGLILAFISPWIRSLTARYHHPRADRPLPRSPRDLAESGGYQVVPPARRVPAARFPSTGRSFEEETPSILRRPADMPVAASVTTTASSRSVRSALSNPGSLRTAILLKEILDTPVSLKDRGR